MMAIIRYNAALKTAPYPGIVNYAYSRITNIDSVIK